MEGRRDGGREGWREGGRQGVRERWMEGEGGEGRRREVTMDGGREITCTYATTTKPTTTTTNHTDKPF